MKKVNYIVVGQGLAGTFLSWFLLKNKKTFIVIDEKKESSASLVAAGIIHPVTGRRIVKSWMADTLLSFAQQTYEEIESFFSKKIFHPIPIVELLTTAREYNDWMSRSEEPEMQSYIGGSIQDDLYDDLLFLSFKKILVKKSSWIDIGTLLSSARDYLWNEDFLLQEKFDFSQLKLNLDDVEYKNFLAEKIIFCEGVEARGNPFWKHLPFLPAKGEVLIIKADMKLEHILNRKIFILPLGENLFKVGSTYTWEFENDKPTMEGRDFLVTQLNSILKIPFEVVDHRAGIRPTVKNRRPFIGLHALHPQIGILNGLGTKGCLLAPYFANHLMGFLTGKNELMKDVDVGKWKTVSL